MDHVDWMDEEAATDVIRLLSKQVVQNGRIILRSASVCPPYLEIMRNHGFDITCIHRADQGDYYMDKVNMYNSFYLAVKT